MEFDKLYLLVNFAPHVDEFQLSATLVPNNGLLCVCIKAADLWALCCLIYHNLCVNIFCINDHYILIYFLLFLNFIGDSILNYQQNFLIYTRKKRNYYQRFVLQLSGSIMHRSGYCFEAIVCLFKFPFF